MNRNLLFSCVVLTGLLAIGCKQTNQVKEKGSDATASQVAVDNRSKTTAGEGVNTNAQILAKPEVPILCYHRIAAGKKGDYTVSPATFSAQMKVLSDSGYHSISPAQLYGYLEYNKPLPQKPVMITFDDSRAEHVAIAAPVLEKYGFKGVFFIMTITYDKKNYLTKDQIAALAKAGHTIGLHTWDHTMVTKYKDAATWKKEIADPKVKLESIVGKPVEFFAYPNGVYNHNGAKELSHYFKLSFTLISKRDSSYPLQTIRRMIVPETKPQRLLNSMRQTFKLV